MKAVYIKHCALQGTTPEKMITKIMREGMTMGRGGLREGTVRKTASRMYPRTERYLSSTKAYVEEYYRANGPALAYASVNDRLFGGALSTSPTVWPEGPEVIITVEEDE